MKKYIINEGQYKGIVKTLMEEKLRGYVFDWDDNILRMPTKIKMDRMVRGEWTPTDVSTEEFAHVRGDSNYRLRDNDPIKAFEDFRKTDSFLRDAKKAIISGSYAPSYEKFKEALMYGNHFAINTARGHKPSALRDGVKMFIDMVLDRDEYQMMIDSIRKQIPETEGLNDDQSVDYYIDHFGEYYPVSSDEFGKRFGLDVSGGAANPEHAKQVAIEHFTKKVFQSVEKLVNSPYKKVSVGFSDDDLGNVRKAEEFIEDQLKHLYPEVHFVVYDTSEGGKKKLVIQKED